MMGLAVFSLLSGKHLGFPGSGGLCTVVLSFMSALAWLEEKVSVHQKALSHLDSILHDSSECKLCCFTTVIDFSWLKFRYYSRSTCGSSLLHTQAIQMCVCIMIFIQWPNVSHSVAENAHPTLMERNLPSPFHL